MLRYCYIFPLQLDQHALLIIDIVTLSLQQYLVEPVSGGRHNIPICMIIQVRTIQMVVSVTITFVETRTIITFGVIQLIQTFGGNCAASVEGVCLGSLLVKIFLFFFFAGRMQFITHDLIISKIMSA